MIAEAKTVLKTFSSKLENVTEEIRQLNDALEYIKSHKDEIMKGLYKHFENFELEALNRACEYLSSEDVKFRFTSWTEEEVAQEGSELGGDKTKHRKGIPKPFTGNITVLVRRGHVAANS